MTVLQPLPPWPLLIAFCLSAGMAVAAESTTWGPDRGTPVTVEAPDQNGHMQTVDSLAGSRGLLLFFNRSADW